MKIAVAGGGPGGLYLAALMKQLDARHEITVWERNAPDDTFGFGVVFSDETLGAIETADVEVYGRMEHQFARWTDIDVEVDGHAFTVGGQGFAAMSRKELLRILQERVADLGVTVHFQTEAPDPEVLRTDYDLVVAADGLNSAVRSRYADVFRPTLDRRHNKYIWFGTDLVFEAFQFFVKQTEWGTMQIHGYPYSDGGSTFIVEMHEDVWRRAGLDRTEGTVFPPGASDDYAVERIKDIFGDELGGHRILTNNSKWLNFHTVRNERWYDGNVVLVGDAAHTAHFSIGSGTKLAMEDALALAACLHEQPDVEAALAAYEAERKPVVESTQRAAQASLEWFENIGMYADQDPAQFVFNLITRSRRITFENLKDRDPDFAARMEAEFARHQGADDVAPAMFQPTRIGALALKNRIIVSSMDMYVAEDGVPDEFHLVHLGSKALGGAGLVMAEMTCVSPEGRITPGCPGLWNDEQRDAWQRVVDFVHERTTARIGVQLGHSGRKGSTKLMWEGMDEPLDEGNWEVIGPSPLPYGEGCHLPREATREDLAEVVAQFVGAARRAVEAGFDLVEVHAAHGYLLSSFLSPISNQRTDEYGGSMENRLRFPLEVFDAVRAEVPGRRPGDRAHLGDRLAAGRQHRARRRRDRPRVHRARGRGHRRLVRAGLQGREAGLRSFLPDALRRPDPARGGQRGRGGGHRGRRHLVVRRRQLDPVGRPSRPVRPRAAPISTTRCGRCTRRPSRTTTAVLPSGRCRGRRVVVGHPLRAPTRSRRGCRCCATREVPRCMSAGAQTPRPPTQRLASPSAPGAGTDPRPRGEWSHPSARTPGCWPRSA